MYRDPQMMLGANLDREIAAMEPLLAAAHERDLVVLFSTVIYDYADLRDAGVWMSKRCRTDSGRSSSRRRWATARSPRTSRATSTLQAKYADVVSLEEALQYLGKPSTPACGLSAIAVTPRQE